MGILVVYCDRNHHLPSAIAASGTSELLARTQSMGMNMQFLEYSERATELRDGQLDGQLLSLEYYVFKAKNLTEGSLLD